MRLFDGLSAAFAVGCRGLVTVHLYRGVRPSTVFARVELPELNKLVRMGLVSLKFEIYLKRRNPAVAAPPTALKDASGAYIKDHARTVESASELEWFDANEPDPDHEGVMP